MKTIDVREQPDPNFYYRTGKLTHETDGKTLAQIAKIIRSRLAKEFPDLQLKVRTIRKVINVSFAGQDNDDDWKFNIPTQRKIEMVISEYEQVRIAKYGDGVWSKFWTHVRVE